MRVSPNLCAVAAALGVAVLGAAATDIGPWYYALHKPAWQPPDWLFAPAWTLIYGLTALAGLIAWRRFQNRRTRLQVMGLFALNAGFNVLWSELFFGLRRPDWALIEVVPFWLSILALMLACRAVSPVSSYVLLPYLLWVMFAGALNLATVRLNAPFGT